MDHLDYDYLGNQLTRVEDATSNTQGFKDVSSAVGTQEYSYDKNGNMVRDVNKGITNIQYNYLNLPQQITLNTGTRIHYTYDAAGIKHQKIVDDGSPETTTYIAGFHYTNDTLQFLQHAEGRTLKSGTTWTYEYNLMDHLGNVRVSVDESGQVVQRDGYYPFGLTFNSSTTSPENLYKLTGNEEQKEWDVFDFNARMYDPALGRFNSIDPLADVNQESWNPYHYNYNNPIAFVDPTGLMPKSGFNETGLSGSSNDDLFQGMDFVSRTGAKAGGGKGDPDPIYQGQELDPVTISASRITNNNPLVRGAISSFRNWGIEKASKNFVDKTIHYSYGGHLQESMRYSMGDGLQLVASRAIGIPLLGTVGAPFIANQIASPRIGLSQRGINMGIDFTTQMIITGGDINKLDGISVIGSGLGANPFLTSGFSFTSLDGFTRNSFSHMVIGGITNSASSSIHGFFNAKGIPLLIGMRKGHWRYKNARGRYHADNIYKGVFDLYGKFANEIGKTF